MSNHRRTRDRFARTVAATPAVDPAGLDLANWSDAEVAHLFGDVRRETATPHGMSEADRDLWAATGATETPVGIIQQIDREGEGETP